MACATGGPELGFDIQPWLVQKMAAPTVKMQVRGLLVSSGTFYRVWFVFCALQVFGQRLHPMGRVWSVQVARVRAHTYLVYVNVWFFDVSTHSGGFPYWSKLGVFAEVLVCIWFLLATSMPCDRVCHSQWHCLRRVCRWLCSTYV